MNHEEALSRARSLRKNMTLAETRLWRSLRERSLGYRFNRQYLFDDKYIVDFYCPQKRLVIEVDGGQHDGMLADDIRNKYLEAKNCRILRFWNNEILENLAGCVEKIKAVLND